MRIRKKCPGCGYHFITYYKDLSFCYNCRKQMGEYTSKERLALRRTDEEKMQEERDKWNF